MNNDFPDDFSIDTEEFNKELEVQKIFLQKQFEERKKENEKKKLQHVQVEYTQEELDKIEQKAEYNANIFLLDKYMYCYKSSIFHNDILGKCSLHYILGSLLREKRIDIGFQDWLDYRIHLTLIQMSGTAKGKTANFISRVIKDTKFPINDIKTGKIAEWKKWRFASILPSGITNSSALLNTYTPDNKGGIKKDKNNIEIITKGSIELYDFFIYEEGGHLFNDSESSSGMVNIFLQAMEPIGSSNNVIGKKLTQYASALTTTSKSSFFFMTRPMGRMKKTVAESGLFQRCLFIPREIENDVALEMQQLSASNKIQYAGGKRNKKDVEFYYDMIEEIKSVVMFAYENDIILNPKYTNDIDAFVVSKLDWFNSNTLKTVYNGDVKLILKTLSNRYADNMLTIAFHSACMRFSKVVDLEDIQYAFNIIKELYEEQKNWLSTTLELNFGEVRENRTFKKELINIVRMDKNGLKTLDTITTDLCKTFELDYKKCYSKILGYSYGNLKIISLSSKDKDAKVRII